MIALALQPGSWVCRIGSFKPLRVLGRYSYGLYLWHQLPDRFFLRVEAHCQTWTSPSWGALLGMAVVFGICFVVAFVSYHTIELPFLRLKRYFAYADESRRHRLNVDQNESEFVAGAA